MTNEQREQRAVLKSQAVALVAKGKLTEDQMALELKICRSSITKWKAEKEFQQHVREHKNLWRVKARTEGLGDKDTRIRFANDEHKRLRALMMQRAKDPQFLNVPGGDTGLLTVTYKMQSMGEGLGSQATPEYRLETGLLERTQALRDEVAIAKGELKLKPKADIAVGTLNVNILMDRINAGRKYAEEHRDKE